MSLLARMTILKAWIGMAVYEMTTLLDGHAIRLALETVHYVVA